MWRFWVFALGILPAVCAAAPTPADWVPVRWPWSDVRSLELLQGSPLNCLLLRDLPAELITAARERQVATLAVIKPGGDAPAQTRAALAAKVDGIVLDGDFPDAAVSAVRDAAGGAIVIELTSRNRMKLGSQAPIL